jgi:glycosyltransferase involved in cell wall biosynthesis
VVVCLLPVRNAASDLPAWFDSVARFADVVVALDDGSTDDTGDVLRAHPLVDRVLTKPRREDHTGWDDSGNRNRLLQAAGASHPDWIISIDSDQLVPREDGEALRRFIEHQAVPGIAYGFPVYRMIGDLEHHDGRENRAYRLFAYRPDQVFPSDRLHFMPIPTSIPRDRWLVTDLRIQHLAGLTTEHRQARRQKYREADPGHEWQEDYSYVERDPGALKEWARRRDGAPVLLESFSLRGADAHSADAGIELEWPALSVVLIVDESLSDDMVDLLDRVEEQERRHAFEVLLVAHGEEVADDLARVRPGSTVVAVPGWEPFERCRNVGLRVARGDYVVCFDAPATFAPGALAAIVDAHDSGCAVVAGDTVNQRLSAAGWASYFDDPGHASFARDPLLRTGGFDEWKGDGAEARARDRLVAGGQRIAHTSMVTFGHRTDLGTPSEYLGRRIDLGRASARRAGGTRRFLAGMVRRDRDRVITTWKRVRQDPPETAAAFDRVRALLLAGVLASWAGASREVLRQSCASRVARLRR